MSTQSKTFVTNTLSQHARALILFAEREPEFAHFLKAQIDFAGLTTQDTTTEASSDTHHLLPISIEHAYERAIWLLQELQQRPRLEAVAGTAELVSWAREYQAPKDQIFGIVGIAIIGPTLGLIKKKKKKKSMVRVVLSEKIATGAARQIAQTAQEASLGLLSTELATVQGNAYRLEPELAEWLFAEHETNLTKLSTQELTDLANWLTAEQLPHYTLTKDEQVVAIAVAPSVTDTLSIGENI